MLSSFRSGPFQPSHVSSRKSPNIKRIVAIVVNYYSAALTVRAVRSIVETRHSESLTVVVVDNSESSEEAHFLKTSLPRSVHLIVAPRNMGFGNACNMAWNRWTGDAVLLLNPDAYLEGNCLEELIRTLNAHARVGAVGPQIYWDPQKRFLLPPSVPPSWIFMLSLADRFGWLALPFLRLADELWRRYALRVWSAREPFPVKNLSGGSVLVRAEAVRDAGGLFDPRFFLYFEDTDLFFRLRKKGWRLAVVPTASVIHEFDRCGLENLERKRRFMGDSRDFFMKKHFPRLIRLAQRIPHERLQGIRRNNGRKACPIFRAPFRVAVPTKMPRPWLFEWSPNPNFIPAAGAFGTGCWAEFSEDCFRRLSPGRYFGRIAPVQGSLRSHAVRFSFSVGRSSS